MIFIIKITFLNVNIMENEQNKKDTKNLDKTLEGFLGTENNDPNLDCSSGVCVIKGDKSLVERINKKIITEDGRQLLY
jgi:hypothetical protein